MHMSLSYPIPPNQRSDGANRTGLHPRKLDFYITRHIRVNHAKEISRSSLRLKIIIEGLSPIFIHDRFILRTTSTLNHITVLQLFPLRFQCHDRATVIREYLRQSLNAYIIDDQRRMVIISRRCVGERSKTIVSVQAAGNRWSSFERSRHEPTFCGPLQVPSRHNTSKTDRRRVSRARAIPR